MPKIESPAHGLHGMYRDLLRAGDGRELSDSGWRKNAITDNCHKVLAGFIAGPPTASAGIQGLLVGQGLDSWDAAGAPPPTPGQTKLVDPNPFLVPRANLQFTFLVGSTPSLQPTNRLQIVCTLGPSVPPWPDVGNHASGNLREFGLVAQLNGTQMLLNYVTHPVIVKDPTSTLTRTVWLVF